LKSLLSYLDFEVWHLRCLSKCNQETLVWHVFVDTSANLMQAVKWIFKWSD
jgi:hypothetical protein